MKKTLLLWLFGLLLTTQVFAQNRTLSGTVKDATTGEALIGVNVTGKGTTIGTVTDIDGKYTLELPKDVNVLLFTYVGYTNLEKNITALKIDAEMSLEGQLLEETVVTAMQIKRNPRSLTTAVTTVTSEDFNQGSTNVIGAIQSKVPGLRINTVGGQTGASTRIILRGETSITGNNNALIVVDGIPINNSVSSNGSSGNNFTDFGNRANDINPEDIESVTVLKGPAAVSLYGSRGSSGVIIYTTKSGKGLANKDKKYNISISSGVNFESAYLQFKRQDKFGQGGVNRPIPIENFSWGPAFDGVVRAWTPPVVNAQGATTQLIRPYSAVKNQLKDAFNLGIQYNNNIALEGATDKFTYFLSYGNTNSKGTLPNTFYKRNSVTGNASAKLGDKVNTKFSVAYTNTSQRGIRGQGNGGSYEGPLQILIQQPVNIPIFELRDYNSIYQDFNGYYAGYTPNPYYILDNTSLDNKADNVIASVELEFKPVSYLSVLGRVGTNFTMANNFIKTPQYDYVRSGSQPAGADLYSEYTDKTNQLTVDFITTFNKKFAKDKVDLTILGGFNSFEDRNNTLFGSTRDGLVVPGFYSLANSKSNAISQNTSYLYRIFGAYGSANVGYKGMLFAEYNARNDWSASLPSGNRGYFYQGGGLSFIPTELIKDVKTKDWLGYWKIRASAGTQGKDAPMYRISEASRYTPSPTITTTGYQVFFPYAGVSGYSTADRIGNPDLKPEKSFEWEVGTELDILKDYVHLEYTYYQKTSKDLIVDVSLPASSGFSTKALNVGEISNKGHELFARVYAVKGKKNINWQFRVQYSKNDNLVKKASSESDEINLSSGAIQVVAKTGYPLGTFKAVDYERDPNGNIVVNALGVPIAATQLSVFGSYQAKYTMGFGSTFSWKGLSFDIQFDLKKGGQFYSGTKEAGDWNGTTVNSLLNNREPYIVPGSVVKNFDGTYSENTVAMEDVFEMVGNLANDVTAQNLIDASYVKLREASISYTFDKKYFKNIPLEGITMSFVGRNLKYWLPKENTYADPESNSFGYNGNVQGLEFTSVPTSRSLGFDVKFKF